MLYETDRTAQTITQTVSIPDLHLSHSMVLSTPLTPEAQAKLLLWQMMLLKSRFFKLSSSSQ